MTNISFVPSICVYRSAILIFTVKSMLLDFLSTENIFFCDFRKNPRFRDEFQAQITGCPQQELTLSVQKYVDHCIYGKNGKLQLVQCLKHSAINYSIHAIGMFLLILSCIHNLSPAALLKFFHNVRATYPGIWAQRFVDTLEIVAGFIIFTLDLLASVEVYIVLPAVPAKPIIVHLKYKHANSE